MTVRINDVGPARADLFGAPFADRHHRRGSIAEQRAADKARHGGLSRGIGERAQLYRHQHRDIVGGTAQIIVQSGHPRCPRDAA